MIAPPDSAGEASGLAVMLTPVVLVHAAGLLVMATNRRMLSVKMLLLDAHREQLELLAQRETDARLTAAQRIRLLDLKRRSTIFLRRVSLLRRSLTLDIAAIIAFLATSLVIGWSGVSPHLGAAAKGVATIGVLMMIAGAVTLLFELRVSLAELADEDSRLDELTASLSASGKALDPETD